LINKSDRIFKIQSWEGKIILNAARKQEDTGMIPFVVLLIIPIFIQHVYVKGVSYQRRNNAALVIFFALLTFLVMFRHESVGNDTRNYINMYYKIIEMKWIDVGKGSIEFGYLFFNKIISLFSKQPQFFLAVAAILVNVMIYPTYKRLCVDSSLTIVVFCIMSTFVMMFSGIRQVLAIGIGFIAYGFTRNKKIVPFVLSVCLAMTVHTSAFMLAFMYPVYHAKITKKWLYAVVPALTFVFVFNRPIFSGLTLFIERYTKYDGSVTQTGAYTMLILFIIFTVFAFLIPEESVIDKETIGLRNFLLFSLVIQMFAPLHNLAMRMNYYYIIFIPLLLPKIIEYRSERWKQVAIVSRHIMVIFFLLYFFFVKANSGGNLNIFPYHFFWENVG